MALIFMEGFDKYATASGQTIGERLVKRFNLSDATDSHQSQLGRDGDGYSIRFRTPGDGHYLYLIPPGNETHSTWIIGFDVYPPVGGIGTLYPFFKLYQKGVAGNGDSLNLEFTTANAIAVQDGSDTPYVTTANEIFTRGTWFHLELKVFCDNTAGTVELKVDGTTVVSANTLNTNYSGISAQQEWNKAALNSPGSTSYSPHIDNVHICDGSGSDNNDFLGRCKVTTLLPTSDAGPNDGVPATGNDHYAMVADGYDSSTGHIATNNDGDKEMFGFPALTETGAVVGVQMATFAINDSASGAKMRRVYESGGTETSLDFEEIWGGGDAFGESEIMETNPDTGNAWTVSEVDGGTFGFELEI